MSELQLLTEFKTGLISFFDELIELFPEESDLIMVRIFLKDQIPIADVMTIFVHKLLPLKDTVKTRDATFFLNNNSLFEDLDRQKINHFKRIWRSDSLTSDDRETIWRWFDSFLYLTKKYQTIKNV